MLPAFIDFHCHLDLYQGYTELLQMCERERIATLAITTTPKAWRRNRELATGTFVRPALGLHPQLVAERAGELPLWEKLLTETRFVGEVGLDAGPKFYSSFEQQKTIFSHILRACAEAEGKVISIHSVRCAPLVINMIEKYVPRGKATIVLHWFTGSKVDAQRAIANGFYFSVNAPMYRSAKGRELIASLPSDRILTETDGPFAELDGRPAKPDDVPALVNELSKERRIPPNDFAKLLIENWLTVVGGVEGWKRG